MMTGTIGRRLLRIAGVLVLAGFTVGCAGTSRDQGVAPAGFGSDPISKAERLVSYCDRLVAKDELVTALGLCARAHEINPNDPETLMRIAAILQALNREEAAIQAYTALLDQYPAHHEARYSLGKVYMETGDAAIASAQFNYAMRSNPEDPRPYNALGILRDQAGEHEAAQALYLLALEREPRNLSVRNNLGLSMALNGQRDQAIEVLAELAADPRAQPMMLRNLEAAYSAGSLPLPAKPVAPAAAVVPAVPDAAAAVKSEPVKVEVLESPPSAVMPRKEPMMQKAPAPVLPAETAPTPLFVPSSGGGTAPQQSRHTTPGSVILAAAEQLLKGPDLADFEPGPSMAPEPVAAAPAPSVAPPQAQNDDVSDYSIHPIETDVLIVPGEFDLSMLVLQGEVGRA